MTFGESLFFSILDLSEYALLLNSLVGSRKPKFTRKMLFLFIIVVLVSGSLSHFFGSEKVFAINLILIIFMIYKIFDANIYESIYAYTIATIILILIQLLLLVTFEISTGNMSYSFDSGLRIHIIALIIVFVISRILPISYLMSDHLMNSKMYRFVSANIFALLIGCLIFWYIESEIFLINAFSFAAILLLIFVMNIFLYTNEIKNEAERKQLEIYKRYFPVVDELIQEIRRKQHDYDNHLQSVEAYINLICPDGIEKLTTYLQDVKDDKEIIQLCKLENKMLAGLIYSKKCSYVKKNIYLEINITNFLIDCKLKDFELIEAIGILLDNAEEASKSEARVILSISKKGKLNFIEVANEHAYISANTCKLMFSEGYSTKEGINRGLGLYNLTLIIKKYKGKYIIQNTNIENKNYVVIKLLFE